MHLFMQLQLSPAGVHIVVQLQFEQVAQIELVVHDKVFASGLQPQDMLTGAA